MTAAMMQPSIKIVIPASDESSDKSSPTALLERLQRTPPEKSRDDLNARDERAKALAELDRESRVERARRANERVKENVARKLRLESAAVARAQSKLDRQAFAKNAKQEALEAKRVASAERSKALFEAVRASREQRQVERENRTSVLRGLEERAAVAKTKRVETTVAKSAARVRHAIEVAAAHKEAERRAAADAAAALDAKMAAADQRRTDKLSATVEGASQTVAAAARTRMHKLYDMKATVEERRARLSRAMERAYGNRQGQLDAIRDKAASENARIAQAVDAHRKEVGETLPAARAHELIVKMQAAEVAHSLALKLHTAQAAAQPKKKAVVIFIPVDEATPRALPPARLLERLLFTPKMLSATAAARHAAAAGKRATVRALTIARASHFGSVRVAVVRGRRAAQAEMARSLDALRTAMAAERAAAALRDKVERAAAFSQRTVRAKLHRSKQRLEMLNGAIKAEEKREAAQLRRGLALTHRQAVAKAQTTTARVLSRREAADAARATKGVQHEHQQMAAALRHSLHLAGIVASAKRARGLRRTTAAPAAAPPATWQRLADKLTESVQCKAAARGVSDDAAKLATALVGKAVEQAVAQATSGTCTAAEMGALEAARATKARKAAAVSEQAAAKALAKAAAKAAEKAAAAAVASAIEQAGLRGEEAKKVAMAKAVAAMPTPADVAEAVEALVGHAATPAPSARSSDSEEWTEVDPKVLRERN